MAHRQLDRAAATEARRAILTSAERFWRPTDLRLPASTSQHILTALVRGGELRRVRRGLYWRGTKTPLGMSPPPHDALISELTGGKGVGLAGVAAANALRLSTQVPRRAQYAVPHRAPASTGAITFVSRTARTGRARSNLNPIEVAALEVLNDWDRVIEVSPDEAMDRLEGLVRDGAIRPRVLARAATTEPAPARERLKALLERSGNGQVTVKGSADGKKKVSRKASSLVAS